MFARRLLFLALFLLAAVPAVAQTRLTFSHHVPATHILHAAAERFAANVKEKTNGQILIDIRPAGQLFNLRTAAEALQLGTLDMCFTDLGTLGNWRPFFGFTSLPFIFNDFDHVKKVFYGPIGEQVKKDAKDQLGIEILSLGASGFRIFLTNKAISKADDARGIKLRVPEIPVWVEMARAIGANPTPIPAGEIYTALQTGVVDGAELPADIAVDLKLMDVAKFATKTHHIFTEVSMMASARRMASLSPEHQKVIREAAVEAIQGWMWAENIKLQDSRWTELGTKMQANATPDIPSFRAKMGPVIDKFVATAGPKGKEYVEAVIAAGK